MAKEKFIRGKHDACKHEGRASTVRREQEATAKLQDYFEMLPGVSYDLGRKEPLPIGEGKPLTIQLTSTSMFPAPES